MVDFQFHFSMLKANQTFLEKLPFTDIFFDDYTTRVQPKFSQFLIIHNEDDNKICVFE